MPQHVVAKVGEIEPGTSKLVTVNGRAIGIFNVKGEYYALLNRCPHEAAPLCRGRIVGMVVSSDVGKFEVLRQGEMLRCPWHGWQFRAQGASLTPSYRSLGSRVNQGQSPDTYYR